MAKNTSKIPTMKPWPAASSSKADSAMIGGVANGLPLTRNGKKTGNGMGNTGKAK